MNYLITGVAGSGKTTIASELKKRVYDAINMDSIQGLCSWVDLATGLPAADGRGADQDWLKKYDWLWNEDKLRQLLGETDGAFFCGSSGNQRELYHLFDKVFLLKTDADLIQERVLDSNRDHSYGRMPGEMEAILGYYEKFQYEAVAAGAIVVDARKPIDEIVDTVLAKTIK